MKLPKTITWDDWAASGGTSGIFAKGVKNGSIKIVEENFDDLKKIVERAKK